MAEYIDREELLKHYITLVKIDWNNKVSPPSWSYAYESFIDYLAELPTADVVPKSEVERLNAVMKDMDEQRAYTINMLGESLETAKRDVEVMGAELSRYTENLMQMREQDKRNIAREIFEEIDNLVRRDNYCYSIRADGVITESLIMDGEMFAELKKKYTEGEK